MFGSEVLDVIIGLFFIYFVLSVISSHVTEIISSIVNLRANNLEQGIRWLLSDPEGHHYANNIYNHPLISKLGHRSGKKPAYIPAKYFILAFFDTASETYRASQSFHDIRTTVEKIKIDSLKKQLLPLVDDAEGDAKKAKDNITQWFNSSMDRTSKLYRKKTQVVILACALILAVVLNADTVSTASNLYYNPTLRSAMLNAAESTVNPKVAAGDDLESEGAGRAPIEPTGFTDIDESYNDIVRELGSLGTLNFPLGWTLSSNSSQGIPTNLLGLINKAIGLLITAFAVSLGAPFWFDALGRVVNLRMGEKRPE